MKKLLMILLTIAIFTLTSCNKEENTTSKVEEQKQEVVTETKTESGIKEDPTLELIKNTGSIEKINSVKETKNIDNIKIKKEIKVEDNNIVLYENGNKVKLLTNNKYKSFCDQTDNKDSGGKAYSYKIFSENKDFGLIEESMILCGSDSTLNYYVFDKNLGFDLINVFDLIENKFSIKIIYKTFSLSPYEKINILNNKLFISVNVETSKNIDSLIKSGKGIKYENGVLDLLIDYKDLF